MPVSVTLSEYWPFGLVNVPENGAPSCPSSTVLAGRPGRTGRTGRAWIARWTLLVEGDLDLQRRAATLPFRVDDPNRADVLQHASVIDAGARIGDRRVGDAARDREDRDRR